MTNAVKVFVIIPVLLFGMVVSALLKDFVGHGQFLSLAIALWVIIWIWRLPPPPRRAHEYYYLADQDGNEQLDCFTYQQVVAKGDRDVLVRREKEEEFCPAHSHPDFASTTDWESEVDRDSSADQELAPSDVFEEDGATGKDHSEYQEFAFAEISDEVGAPKRAKAGGEAVGSTMGASSCGSAQRLVVAIGLVVMFLVGLFPPKHTQREFHGQKAEAGRKVIWETRDDDNWLIETDVEQLFTEWATIAFGTGAAFVVVGFFRRKRGGASGDGVAGDLD